MEPISTDIKTTIVFILAAAAGVAAVVLNKISFENPQRRDRIVRGIIIAILIISFYLIFGDYLLKME
jgi:small neutral amino acid transporter SnatA (MarC family)